MWGMGTSVGQTSERTKMTVTINHQTQKDHVEPTSAQEENSKLCNLCDITGLTMEKKNSVIIIVLNFGFVSKLAHIKYIDCL